MATPDRRLADLDDDWTNVMFVGRVIPNKKFEDVIRAFHAYRTRHNPRSRLLLVGSYSGFENYLAMLQGLIARLGTPDVHFLGHVSNEELTALYDVADVFLCASEHEGFCVPIIEAFYKRIPVLAYAATAVPATMDGGGVLYDTKDPLEIARLMDAVLDDPRIEEAVLQSQDASLSVSARGISTGRCFDSLTRRSRTPPREAPEVTWDFWHQFDQFDRFEELRQFRPACIKRYRQRRLNRITVRTGADHSRRCRSRIPDASPAAMIINQWVPAAHKGDAIGDSARRVRGMLRAAGHTSDLYALTMDDELRGDVRPFDDPEARRGDATIFHFALPSPMTHAFASLQGRRIVQYHNITPASFFAPYDAGLFQAGRARAAGIDDAGRTR